MTKRSQVVTSVIGATVAGVAGAGYYWFFRRPLPQTHGALKLKGLHEPVEVLRDQWGIPHIYAHNAPDLFFSQGFIHAQDRLWQMEFQRRVGSGRLSEVLGERTLKADRWLRILGFERVAEETVKHMPAATRQLLDAYVAGVNAHLDSQALPVEFSILRFTPEAWRAEDTLVWLKMMAWSLSVNWEAELLRAQLIERLGAEMAAGLEPSPDFRPGIVPAELTLHRIGLSALTAAAAARPYTGPNAGDGVGSNSWVLAGRRSASGKPLLANDMHLTMGAPAIWYENHLVGEAFNVTGVSLPGVPGVIAGHNGQVAWGVTAGFADVQDIYVEHLRETPDGGVQVEFQGSWQDAIVFEEEIAVRGADTVVERVIVTPHGPIINSLAPQAAGEDPLALQWTANQPAPTLQGLFNIGRVGNAAAFQTALTEISEPVLNFVFADTQGNFGYTYAGRIPRRARAHGGVPVPGWTGTHEWQGMIPFEELPHLFNPERDFIITANNRVMEGDYAHDLGHDFSIGDRALRIQELLHGRARLTVGDMQVMQFDLVSPTARAVAQRLGQLETSEPKLARAAALLRAWDGELAADSAAAALYQVFMRRLITHLLDPKLGVLTPWYAGQSPNPVLTGGSVFGQRAWEWAQQVLAQPDSVWFDLGEGQAQAHVLQTVLGHSVAYLEKELGEDWGAWGWGRLHSLRLNHVLGSVKPLDALFSRGPFPIGGDNTTVWATGAGTHHLDSSRMISAPFRFVADLADLRHAWGVLIPGQSGHPASPHYDDQIEQWFDGVYHPMLYDRADVEAGCKERLQLTPA